MTKPLSISDRLVGPGQPTLVIAEIGVNHDGSVARALELVSAAAGAGADAVKLQIFRARTLMHRSGAYAAYQRERCDEAGPVAMLSRYELGESDLRSVVVAIRDRGMIPLATPFSPSDVAAVDALRLPAVKIASPDLVNRPLLTRAAQLGNPLLLSTGAATLREVETTAEWLRNSRTPFALLHCVSSYPAPNEHANLCWISELASTFDVPVGYSDHTTEALSGALAAVAGACIIEKHLTYDRAAAGPDHSASADPGQFSEYVRQIRLAERLRGRPGKRVLDVEEDVRRVSRQSVVLQCDRRAGDLLSAADLTVQRPGTGIPAAMSDAVVGRRVLRGLPAGTLLQWDMLSDAA